jgi:hypothetical protein
MPDPFKPFLPKLCQTAASNLLLLSNYDRFENRYDKDIKQLLDKKAPQSTNQKSLKLEMPRFVEDMIDGYRLDCKTPISFKLLDSLYESLSYIEDKRLALNIS